MYKINEVLGKKKVAKRKIGYLEDKMFFKKKHTYLHTT